MSGMLRVIEGVDEEKDRLYGIPIRDVEKGDVIKDGPGKKIEVVKIEHNACSSGDTHVNGRHCFSRYARVVLTGEKIKDSEEHISSN